MVQIGGLFMKIAQLATNVERIPPEGYGGTELIVSLLTEELLKRGHEITLFAVGNSKTNARLISVTEKPLRTEASIKTTQWPAYDLRSLLLLKEMSGKFDLIHNHMGYLALPFLDNLDCAVVTTNHNPIKLYCADIYLAYKHLPYVAISNAYVKFNYADQLNYVATVYNGIDCRSFDASPTRPGKYFLFLGRLCHDKGTAEALDIAKKLELPIILAGKVDERDAEYFEREIKPRLQYERAKFIGEVNEQQKARLYSEAIAVLYPINFDEPFGLVMAEALASGIPVIAFDRGSVREILLDGVNAVIGHSIDELVQRFPEIEKLRPDDCKRHVQENFSVSHMVNGYEKVYQRLISEKGKTRH